MRIIILILSFTFLSHFGCGTSEISSEFAVDPIVPEASTFLGEGNIVVRENNGFITMRPEVPVDPYKVPQIRFDTVGHGDVPPHAHLEYANVPGAKGGTIDAVPGQHQYVFATETEPGYILDPNGKVIRTIPRSSPSSGSNSTASAAGSGTPGEVPAGNYRPVRGFGAGMATGMATYYVADQTQQAFGIDPQTSRITSHLPAAATAIGVGDYVAGTSGTAAGIMGVGTAAGVGGVAVVTEGTRAQAENHIHQLQQNSRSTDLDLRQYQLNQRRYDRMVNEGAMTQAERESKDRLNLMIYRNQLDSERDYSRMMEERYANPVNAVGGTIYDVINYWTGY